MQEQHARARRLRASKSLRNDSISRTFLAREVIRRIKALGYTQTLTAKVVNDAATQMSRLCNGHFAEFSADRLAGFLRDLGSDVQIVVKHGPRTQRRGRITYKVAR